MYTRRHRITWICQKNSAISMSKRNLMKSERWDTGKPAILDSLKIYITLRDTWHRVDAPDSSGGRWKRRVQGLRADFRGSPCQLNHCFLVFRTRDNARSYSVTWKTSTTRGSPDMTAIPTVAIPRLLYHRHRHYLRDRHSCQTTEQVLPRGGRSGIGDFLWYYTRDATTKKWVPVSRRSIDVTRTFLAHSSLLNRRCVLVGVNYVRCEWVSRWGGPREDVAVPGR